MSRDKFDSPVSLKYEGGRDRIRRNDILNGSDIFRSCGLNVEVSSQPTVKQSIHKRNN